MKIKLTEKYFIEVTKNSFLIKEMNATGKDVVSFYNTMDQALNGAANLILMEEVGDNYITLHEYQYRLLDVKDDLMTGVYGYGN